MELRPYLSSWWLFPNPLETYYTVVKLDHFPKDRVESKMFEVSPPNCGKWKVYLKKQIRGRPDTQIIPHRIHGTGIFTYMYHKFMINVGKYSSPMDPMGPKDPLKNRVLEHQKFEKIIQTSTFRAPKMTTFTVSLGG